MPNRINLHPFFHSFCKSSRPVFYFATSSYFCLVASFFIHLAAFKPEIDRDEKMGWIMWRKRLWVCTGKAARQRCILLHSRADKQTDNLENGFRDYKHAPVDIELYNLSWDLVTLNETYEKPPIDFSALFKLPRDLEIYLTTFFSCIFFIIFFAHKLPAKNKIQWEL